MQTPTLSIRMHNAQVIELVSFMVSVNIIIIIIANYILLVKELLFPHFVHMQTIPLFKPFLDHMEGSQFHCKQPLCGRIQHLQCWLPHHVQPQDHCPYILLHVCNECNALLGSRSIPLSRKEGKWCELKWLEQPFSGN